jgi:hypothetical protein
MARVCRAHHLRNCGPCKRRAYMAGSNYGSATWTIDDSSYDTSSSYDSGSYGGYSGGSDSGSSGGGGCGSGGGGD